MSAHTQFMGQGQAQYPTQLAIANVTLSYVHVFEPFAYAEGNEPKYSTTLLIDKTDTESIDLIKKAIQNAQHNGAERIWNHRMPSNIRLPLLDGDDKAINGSHQEYAGKYYLNAKADQKHPPIIEDNRGREIPKEESSKVYSGCKALVIVNFYPYAWNGASNGIGVSLQGLIKTGDGDPLGGSHLTQADMISLIPTDDNDEDSDID